MSVDASGRDLAITAPGPPDRLLSARDAELVLGIPAATVRTWFRRQPATGLFEYGRDERGAPMFRARHLLALRAGRHRPV